SGSADGAVHVWDATSGETLGTWQAHAAGVTGLAFDRTGQRLASTGEGVDQLGELKSWDPAKGRVLAGKTPPTLLTAAAFSSDGRRLATAGHDGSVTAWDAATLEPVLTYQGHTERTPPWAGVAISADGRWVAAGSPDGLVRVWDAVSSREYLSV